MYGRLHEWKNVSNCASLAPDRMPIWPVGSLNVPTEKAKLIVRY